jgi:hypothetical protein
VNQAISCLPTKPVLSSNQATTCLVWKLTNLGAAGLVPHQTGCGLVVEQPGWFGQNVFWEKLKEMLQARIVPQP